MKNNKSVFIENIIDKMTLEQKVGQCLVIGFVGTVITPEILKRIRQYYPAGIRAGLTFRVKTATHDPTSVGHDQYAERVVRHPKGTVKDFLPNLPIPHCTNEEYCAFINQLKQAALDNDLGIPLHITMDMEGDTSADYNRGGIHYFPSPMAFSLGNAPHLAREVAWAVGRQLRPLGCDWLHSPVLDVNTHPLNPEIGTRSYGEDPETVTTYALEALKGYQAAGRPGTVAIKVFIEPGTDGGNQEESNHDKRRNGMSEYKRYKEQYNPPLPEQYVPVTDNQ